MELMKTSHLKWTLKAVLLLVAALSAAVALNTLRQGTRQLHVTRIKPLALDEGAAARRLAGALRFRTVSIDERTNASADQFLEFHAYLQRSYPRAHSVLRREIVNSYSLLYTWTGTDPLAKPVMLMAHQDVVPIAPGTEADWEVEPFGGIVHHGFVWGRGAWDDKGNLMAMMEAIELLVSQGFRPRQTIYLAFGHDEEIGGTLGAKAIAQLLRDRGVRLAFALDEGLLVTQGILPGVTAPVALVGTVEKGMVTLALRTSANAGHSSMPSAQSAIGTLSKALARLEDQPLPVHSDVTASQMFATLAPEMTGLNRIALSNRWLLGPLVDWKLQKAPTTNAFLRTTTALTVIRGGNKVNVLPKHAEAFVNFRLLPGDSSKKILANAKSIVSDDRVEISIAGVVQEPSRRSRSNSPAFRLIERTVRETLPGTLVAPALVIGGTDGRHMEVIADDVYRLSPMLARKEDLPRYHGTNERVSIANYAEAIRFYSRFLVNANAPNPSKMHP